MIFIVCQINNKTGRISKLNFAITSRSDFQTTFKVEISLSQTPHLVGEVSVTKNTSKDCGEGGRPLCFFFPRIFFGSSRLLIWILFYKVFQYFKLLESSLTNKLRNVQLIPCFRISIVFPYRRLNHVAVMIQNGGLAFLRELEFLSNKLLKVNPPLFHNIDPTTLPPKQISTTLKHARTDLIFKAANKRTQDSKKYADFGFESTEVDFVKAAVQLLCLFAQTTAPQFDPCLEDMKVLEHSRSRNIKRHISFHKSAVLVKNALRLTKGSDRRRIIRSRSARFVFITY